MIVIKPYKGKIPKIEETLLSIIALQHFNQAVKMTNLNK